MKTTIKINIFLLTVFVFCFACVLLTGSNKALFMRINSFSEFTGRFIWSSLTFLGDSLPVCALMLLFIRKRPDLVWSGILATIIATVIVNILKSYFNLPRPPSVIDNDLINIIGPVIHSRAFPSGHAVTIFTLSGIVIFYLRSVYLQLSMFILALLVGISRIVVGVHWPSDILAGAAIGILCAMSGLTIVYKMGWKRNKILQLTVGLLLILADLYLMFFYDCKYKQAIYLQTIFAMSVMIFGIREYYLLLTESK